MKFQQVINAYKNSFNILLKEKTTMWQFIIFFSLGYIVPTVINDVSTFTCPLFYVGYFFILLFALFGITTIVVFVKYYYARKKTKG